MIRASIRATKADLVAFADHLARTSSTELALLLGDGFGDPSFGIEPIDRIVVPAGAGMAAVSEVLAEIDASSASSPEGCRGWDGRAPAPRWVGMLAYEAGRGLERRGPDTRLANAAPDLHLLRFGAVLRLDRRRGQLVCEGDDERQVARSNELAHHLQALRATGRLGDPVVPTLELRPRDGDDVHRNRIERALGWIAAGDIYQVNLARTLEGPAPAGPLGLLADPRWSSARFAAAIACSSFVVVSASPELLLEVDSRWQLDGALATFRHVRTDPIKGTRPRGHSEAEERRLLDELRLSPKERAELTMIVDLSRNDLGRIACTGSVRVLRGPIVHTTPYVHHSVHPVVALVSPSRHLGEIVSAVFPGGSVTGAPKPRAMEVIAELEAERRGLYCGALLVVDRGGGLRASMTIRTLETDAARRRARYMVGGGIVADSNPALEVAETHWKSRLVTPP